MAAPPGHDADARLMARAIELARTGWGCVHPNPLVGAVVARDGAVVGEGAHREFGGDHAEVEALRQAGHRADGATLYVTLEPCAHHGKTPPCTDAILAAGVRRVVYAVADPDPGAAGGAALLADRGLDVRGDVLAAEARAMNALFLRPLETGRPFVALKLALSLDSRIAAAEGQATRITGPAAEAHVHRLRAGFDAILVGGRTARVDDPLLTVRGEIVPRTPPVRVVATSRAELDPASRLAASARDVPVIILAGEHAPADAVAALEERGAAVLAVPAGPDGLDMHAAIDRLGKRGIRTVLCEGGGQLGAALLRAGRVDRLYLYHAPRLLGAAGVPGFPGADPGFDGVVVEAGAVGGDAFMVVDRSG